MKRQRLFLLIVLIFLTLAVCSSTGVVALTFAGMGAGITQAFAPGFNNDIVEWLVCPEGTTLEYREVRYSYHQPGEAAIVVSCVTADGVRYENLEFQYLFAVVGTYFFACFVPLCLSITLFLWFLVLVGFRALTKERRKTRSVPRWLR
ncbi:MAG: hypothetical protein MUO67_14920 [Anaerolineales bacterium]|nr:hypothetical protein [Anaerolineales bacterium]